MKFKTLLTIGLCAGLGSGFAAGRTWTSADGSKTFEGDFESFDKDANKVTVTKNGRPLTFGLEIISADDQAWVKQQPSIQDLEAAAEAEAAAAAEFADSEAGKALRKTKILKDGKFVDFEYENPPKYFILYYSGSW
jgi:hypothetical protein